MSKKRFIRKDADTGKIVTEEYMEANPKTTYKHYLADDENHDEEE